jgi:hypothetical protein
MGQHNMYASHINQHFDHWAHKESIGIILKISWIWLWNPWTKVINTGPYYMYFKSNFTNARLCVRIFDRQAIVASEKYVYTGGLTCLLYM